MSDNDSEISRIHQTLASLDTLHRTVSGRLRQFADASGGTFVSPDPSAEEYGSMRQVTKKGWVTHRINEPGGYITATAADRAGERSNWGHITYPQNEKDDWGEPVEISFRGMEIIPGQPQVAPLARYEGIHPDDIKNYLAGQMSLNQLINLASDPEQKSDLKQSLIAVRQYQESGMSELEALSQYHTALPGTGSPNLSLWVSSGRNPDDAYYHPAPEHVYGPIDGRMSLHGVAILSTPRSQTMIWPHEVGIVAEIKPEYVLAIVPATGPKEQVFARVDAVLTNIRNHKS